MKSVTFKFWVTLEFSRPHGNLKPKRFDFCIEYKPADRTWPFHYQWLELFGLLEEIGIKSSVAFLKCFSIYFVCKILQKISFELYCISSCLLPKWKRKCIGYKAYFSITSVWVKKCWSEVNNMTFCRHSSSYSHIYFRMTGRSNLCIWITVKYRLLSIVCRKYN